MRWKNTEVFSYAHRCHGAAYIELIFSLGAMFTIFLSSIDLGLMIDTRNRMSVLARETANDAFKACWDQTDPTACLWEVRSRNVESARTVGLAKYPLPDATDANGNPVPRERNFEVILSIYTCGTYTCTGSCDPGATESEELNNPCSCTCGSIQLRAVAPDSESIDPQLRPIFPTRYNVGQVNSALGNTLQKHGQILIAEVILQHDGVTELTDQGIIYEESVF